MVGRALREGVDALCAEGGDDQAVVNALVRTRLGVDLGKPKLVKAATNQASGKEDAFRRFDALLARAQVGARIGLVVDRDSPENDSWPRVVTRLPPVGSAALVPEQAGVVFEVTAGIRAGVWMWPDNVRHGALEDFVRELLPADRTLAHARESTLEARTLGAEYDLADEDKAILKVRSIWFTAGAAGGYGHVVAGFSSARSPAADGFLAWFERLFLAE